VPIAVSDRNKSGRDKQTTTYESDQNQEARCRPRPGWLVERMLDLVKGETGGKLKMGQGDEG
jgi:hypothetical protein